MITSDTHDPASQVGEIFKRLASARDALGEPSFGRVVSAVLIALAAATLVEAERHAKALAERTGGARPTDVRVTAWNQRKGGEPLDESIGPS